MSASEIKARLIVILLLIVVIFFIFEIDGCVAHDTYNNGHCPCGGHYVYMQAVGHRYTTDYLYKCDKCGRTIEIANYYE